MAEPRVAASPACNELKAYHVKVFRDISYWRSGASNDETEHPTKHKLNVHIPVDDTGKIVKRKLPCVVHIHGGGWKRGDRYHEFYGAPFMSNAYSSQMGFIAVAPSYRLAIRFPANIQDIAKVFRWVYDNIESYGGDTRRVFVSGHSAGAHLAALVALDKRFLADVAVPPSFIKGVVSISGIYTVAAPLPGGINSWTNWGFRKVYVHTTFGTNERDWHDASPITFVRKPSDSGPLSPLRQEPNPPTEAERANSFLGLESLGEVDGIEATSSRLVLPDDIPPSESAVGYQDLANWQSNTALELPPFLVLNAQTDLGLQHDGEVFFKALQEVGANAEYSLIPNTSHASVTRSTATATAAYNFISRILEELKGGKTQKQTHA